MSKHTPGPWSWVNDGYEIAIIGRPHWPCEWNGWKGRWSVAVIDDMMEQDSKEVKANTRLIAAAPELLEACDQLAQCLQTPDGEQPYDMGTGQWSERISAALDKATAAIAKATGVKK